jgi:hypothetical protein
MAKKNNKNRQYTAKPSIIDDSVVESIQENTSVETETVEEPTPEVEEVVEETVEISEAPKVVEELHKVDVKEVIPEKVEKPVVEKKPTVTKPVEKISKPVPVKKEEVKKPATKSNLYQLVFIANATPLQVNKTVKRLKELNVLYDYNGTDILGATFASESEAIEQKKYYAGKGLKPTIRRL